LDFDVPHEFYTTTGILDIHLSACRARSRPSIDGLRKRQRRLARILGIDPTGQLFLHCNKEKVGAPSGTQAHGPIIGATAKGYLAHIRDSTPRANKVPERQSELPAYPASELDLWALEDVLLDRRPRHQTGLETEVTLIAAQQVLLERGE